MEAVKFSIKNTDDAVEVLGLAVGTLNVLKDTLERMEQGDLNGTDLAYLHRLADLVVNGLREVIAEIDDLAKA